MNIGLLPKQDSHLAIAGAVKGHVATIMNQSLEHVTEE